MATPKMTELDYPETTALYWLDTYKFESNAKVLGVESYRFKDVDLFAVILDQTIFHPQGGGQPSDTGKITSKTATFNVTMSQKQQNGAVLHLGQFEGEPRFEKGQEVQLAINQENRKLFARLHSAGHLLDIAVINCGFTHFQPGKGYHFADSPYVEYIGKIDNKMSEEYKKKLNEELKKLIDQNHKSQVQVVPYQKIESLCGSTPPYLPKDKEARIVTLAPRSDNAPSGCPCSGT